ncbi:MAG: non-ribosomal peptide synthetase, partial [bacterium]|nr:non-ribosomal peptide synthetase [bacterium]
VKTDVGSDENFFQLGGHSLSAVLMVSRIYKTFNVRLPLAEVFRKPTIRGLAQYIKKAAGNKYQAMEPVEKKDYYHLSAAQKRLYVLQQIDLENTVYNMPETIPLQEGADITRLETTFKKLIKRHESLRTSFHMVAGGPVQRISETVNFEIKIIAGENPESAINELIRPFQLSQAPLMRVALIKTGNNNGNGQMLVVDMHHIISDDVSHRILRHDFAAIEREEELPALPIQYKEYAQWQREPEQQNGMKQQETYWLKEFEGKIPLLEIPADYERPEQMSFEGASIDKKINPELTGKIKKLAAREEVTLLMLMKAIYNVLLSKYCSLEQIVVGTVIAGRQHPDMENVIGFFVNMLAIKTAPQKNKTFNNYLAEVKEKCLKAYENQTYQFEELVAKLEIERQPGRHPLIDTVFVLHETGETPETVDTTENNLKNQPGENGDAKHEQETYSPHKSAHFDLMLHTTVAAATIHLMFEYSTALFKESTIEDFAVYYIEILEQVVENPQIPLEEISITLNLLTATSTVIPDDDDDWDI